MRDRAAALPVVCRAVLLWLACQGSMALCTAQAQRHTAQSPPPQKPPVVRVPHTISPHAFYGPPAFFGPQPPHWLPRDPKGNMFPAVPLFVRPLPPPAPPPVRKAAWNAVLPADLLLKATHVDIDAGDMVGTFPTLMRGLAVNSTGAPLSDTEWRAAGQYLRIVNGPLMRLEPMKELDAITVDGAGNGVIHWAKPDLLLNRAAAASSAIVFRITPPVLSVDKWDGYLRDVIGRYGENARYGVARWELACNPEEIGRYYPAFARTARAMTPAVPIGIGVTSDNVVAAARKLADTCSLEHIPCDSFSWTVSTDPPTAAFTMRRIRSAFARSVDLKGTTLLPEINPAEIGNKGTDGPGLVSLLTKLGEDAEPGGVNPLLGVLAPLSDVLSSGERVTQTGVALAALNRISGARLRTSISVAGVHALAVRTREGVATLLWRDDKDAGDRLAVARVKKLSGGLLNGLRLERYETLFPLTASNPPGSPAPADTWTPAADTDISGDGTEVEASVLLGPRAVALVVLRPVVRPVLQLELKAPRYQIEDGQGIEITATLKNISGNPVASNLLFSQMGGNLLTAASNHLSVGALAPGHSATFHLRLAAPSVARSQMAYLNASASGAHASLTFRLPGTLDVRLESPRVDLAGPGRRAEATLRFVNSGQTPLKLAVRLVPDTGVPLDPILVPAKSTLVRRIELRIPERDPGSYPVDLIVEENAVAVRSFRMTVGVPVLCRHAGQRPSFSGDRGEWTDADYIGMGRREQVHGKYWAGPTDLSAIAYTKWDEGYLYFACAVTDDVFRQPFPASEMSRGDSVQIAIRTDENEPPDITRYGVGDIEFGSIHH